MAKYAYPAIFAQEDDGSFSIDFPDLEGCHTCGDSLEDGLEMAEDALALVLYGYEKDGRAIPAPSSPNAFTLSGKEFVNYVACDTMTYRKTSLDDVPEVKPTDKETAILDAYERGSKEYQPYISEDDLRKELGI